MPWKPSVRGEISTLGWGVLDWMSANLNSPSGDGTALQLTREQEDFTLRWYSIDRRTGRFPFWRGLIGRARGWGKSPFLAALAVVEGLGPVLFDGWDAAGQPVGKPWVGVREPIIQVAAVSEDQTRNTWDALFAMVEDAPVIDNYPGVEPMLSLMNLPVGRIERIAASARSVKGARAILGILDQTEEWVASNGGVRLAQTMRTNATKVGGRTLESPNAYMPGEGSVAEASAHYAESIAEGKTRAAGLLWDHREAPADTDMTDRDSLVAGLRYAYGDSSDDPRGCVLHTPPCPPGWAPIQSNADMFWDPANDVQQLRSDFLNQIVSASDAYIERPEWNARSVNTLAGQGTVVKPLAERDEVTLGFDGSRKRARGVADATALVACRVSDGYVAPIRVWEQPDGPAGDDWRVPIDEVRQVVAETFRKYKVVGFFADPAKWEGVVAEWEAAYGARLIVKASRSNPIEWWFSGRRSIVTQALDAFRGAVAYGEMSHSGDSVLTRHVLNAHVRRNPSGYGIYKAYPDSWDKIDACIAAVLAWQARLEAVAAGAGKTRIIRAPRRLY